MEIVGQLENELNVLREKRKSMVNDLKKTELEIEQKTKAFYILKGQRVPQYIAKNPKKKHENAIQ